MLKWLLAVLTVFLRRLFGSQKGSMWQFMVREKITRADGRPYLDRTTILRTPFFTLFLHRFLGSDDDCLHDHPWRFISVIVKGGYREWTQRPASAQGDGEFLSFPAHMNQPGYSEVGHWYGAGSVLFRPAAWKHRVELHHSAPGTLTLVLTGIPVRKWGFWTKSGWIYWRRYNHHQHCGA